MHIYGSKEGSRVALFVQILVCFTFMKNSLVFISILCVLSLCVQGFDDFIFAFFAIEMVIKMVALGIFGKKCYLGDTWNRLDFFIVLAG